MARVNFDSVFEENTDGSFSPKQRIRVGGVILSPGVSFREGVIFGGVNFSKYKGHDLEIETDKDIIVIKGIY